MLRHVNITSLVDPSMKIWFNEIDSAFRETCSLGIVESQIIEFLAYCTLWTNTFDCQGEITLLTACLPLGIQNPDSLILFRIACISRCLHPLWFSVIISLVKLWFLANKTGLIISSSYVIFLLILPLVRIIPFWSRKKFKFFTNSGTFLPWGGLKISKFCCEALLLHYVTQINFGTVTRILVYVI